MSACSRSSTDSQASSSLGRSRRARSTRASTYVGVPTVRRVGLPCRRPAARAAYSRTVCSMHEARLAGQLRLERAAQGSCRRARRARPRRRARGRRRPCSAASSVNWRGNTDSRRKHDLLAVGQQRVVPVDGRTQRPLPLGQVDRPAAQRVERVLELAQQCGRWQQPGPGSGELERQRHPVEPAADLGCRPAFAVGEHAGWGSRPAPAPGTAPVPRCSSGSAVPGAGTSSGGNGYPARRAPAARCGL